MHFGNLAATLFVPVALTAYPAEPSASNPSARAGATKAIALIQEVGAHFVRGNKLGRHGIVAFSSCDGDWLEHKRRTSKHHERTV